MVNVFLSGEGFKKHVELSALPAVGHHISFPNGPHQTDHYVVTKVVCKLSKEETWHGSWVVHIALTEED